MIYDSYMYMIIWKGIIWKLWYDSYMNEFSYDSYISFQHDSDIIVFYIRIICGEIEIKKRYGSSSP